MTRSAPSEPPRIQVLIVDQHLAFRDALAARLQAEPDLAVVAKAHSAEFAPRVLVGRSADVILLDAELPDNSAIAFCAERTPRADAPRVVMLSAASKPERIVAAVRAGVALTDCMNGIEAAQLIVRRPAKQADVWPADIDSAEDIANGCPDRQHVISACIEGGRQRFGEHPLLITDNYFHYDYSPLPGRA